MEWQSTFAADNPAMFREPFAGHLWGTPACVPGGMRSLPQVARTPSPVEEGQEDRQPVLLGREEAPEPGGLGASGA